MTGTEVIFPLSTKLCLIGSFEGRENVVEADIFTAGSINTILIGSAEKQVYANDYTFNYMRPLPLAMGTGAGLVQDLEFLASGKPDKVVRRKSRTKI